MIYPNKPLYLLSLLGYIYYLTYYTLTTKDNINHFSFPFCNFFIKKSAKRMPFIKMVLLTLISIINNVCMDTGSISRKGSTKINYTSILTQDMEYVKRIYTRYSVYDWI